MKLKEIDEKILSQFNDTFEHEFEIKIGKLLTQDEQYEKYHQQDYENIMETALAKFKEFSIDTTELKNLFEKEKKEEKEKFAKLMEAYKASKNGLAAKATFARQVSIIKDNLEKDVELIELDSNITLINVKDVIKGKFKTFKDKYNKYVYICNNMTPSISYKRKNYHLVCYGDFLVKDGAWQVDCKNFLIDKFGAIHSMGELAKKLQKKQFTGEKPDWLDAYLFMA